MSEHDAQLPARAGAELASDVQSGLPGPDRKMEPMHFLAALLRKPVELSVPTTLDADVPLMISQVNSAAKLMTDLQEYDRRLRQQLEDLIERENRLHSQRDESSNALSQLEKELQAERARLESTEMALRIAESRTAASAKQLLESEKKLLNLAGAIESAFSVVQRNVQERTAEPRT